MKTKIKTLDVLISLFCIWGFIIIGAMIWQGVTVLKSYF